MTPIRLTEWGSRRVPQLNLETRRALLDAAKTWQLAHRLPQLPIHFGGLDGQTISARQWVGIVEVEGARVEIFPKLDAKLLDGVPPDESIVGSTLTDLLRMLEAAAYNDWIETGRASLGETELTFPDVWAFLLSKHLSVELRRGLVSNYLPHQGDLARVRGKIAVSRQVGSLFNRQDRIACEWDEWSPDITLNRLLKCACLKLQQRTIHPIARGLIADCVFALDEVTDVSPQIALRETEQMVWTRGNERFRSTFKLARRLLRDLSPELEGGNHNSWAFLVDMNAVFEGFCRAALEARFRCFVQEQVNVGTLFREPNRTRQLADFVWKESDKYWVGDAKWKLLSSSNPQLAEEETVTTNSISPADVRQLTIYTLLVQEQQRSSAIPEGAILYPVLNQENLKSRTFSTWNGTKLHLWPVRVNSEVPLKEAILISIK